MNPYDYSSGLGGFERGYNIATGVADRFAQNQQLEQQQQAQAQQAEKANQLQSQLESAYKAGDVDALNLLSIQAPDISKNLLGAIEKKTGAKQDEIVSLAEKITYNPSDSERLITDRIQMIQKRGGDPSDSVRMLQELRKDPKKFLNDTKMMFAMTAPKEKYDRYKQVTGGSGAPEYSKVEYDEQGNPFGLNKSTGQFEPIQGGFQKAKRAPETVVNVGKAEGEQSKTIAKAEGENYNQIIKDANSSRQSDQQLSRLESLNEKAFEGSAAGLMKFGAKLLSPLGVDVEGLTETELFESIGNNLVLNQTSKLSGVLTDKDMDMLASTVPQLSQTREGRKELIGVMRELNNASQDKARLASKYRKENNGQFESQGFEEWLTTQPKKDRFSEIKVDTKTDVETPAGLGSKPITEMSDAELMKSLGL